MAAKIEEHGALYGQGRLALTYGQCQAAFVLKAKAIIIGLAGAGWGWSWAGCACSGIACQSFGVVIQSNMQTRTGNNVAAARHAGGHTHTLVYPCTDMDKVRSLSFNSLAKLTFCRVCALHNNETSKQQQQQQQRKHQLYG